MNIISLSIQRPTAVIAMVLMIVLFGWVSLTKSLDLPPSALTQIARNNFSIHLFLVMDCPWSRVLRK